ncbi:MAG TPA: hypothetical protein VF020_09915 [Chthoniobacterales bacterium]
MKKAVFKDAPDGALDRFGDDSLVHIFIIRLFSQTLGVSKVGAGLDQPQILK